MQETVNQDREKYIGGSDIPVIMNLSPFKSRYDLLLEKAGYKENDFFGNVFTDYGNTMEPIIRDYINSNYVIASEDPFIEGKHVRDALPDETIGVRIHTDGENNKAILEIKTTSNVQNDVNDYKVYLVQLLYYMVLTGRNIGVLAVYERPDDMSEEFDEARLHSYTIKAEDYSVLIGEIKDACEVFIKDLEKVKADPFITEQDLLPAEIPSIADRILAFESQLAYMKKVEEEVKSEKKRLKNAMQAANIKTWITPSGYRITLVPDGEDKIEDKFDSKKFKAENEELYKKYCEATVKKGREGYILITAPSDVKEV